VCLYGCGGEVGVLRPEKLRFLLGINKGYRLNDCGLGGVVMLFWYKSGLNRLF
jgi:hypothetical protein